MADVALQFAVDTLVGIVKENWKLIGGAKEECDNLVKELDDLKAFLLDAAKYRKSNSEQWKNFVKKVQVTVYKAEGFIDKLLVKVKLHQDKNPVLQALDAKYAFTIRDLASNIKASLEQVNKIRQENPKAFEATPILAAQPEVVVPLPQDTLLEDNEVVGFDEEAKKVINRLDKGTTDLDVIPVVGLPGLGKTTLAVKIYQNTQLSFDFFKIIWVYVGPEYKLNEVLLGILKGFTERIAEYKDKNVNELTKEIDKFISKGGKCLIVLDDVWATDIVESVMKVFPENNKGHRILLTTRDIRVARYANNDPHFLKFLEQEESFQLLVNRVFGIRRRCPDDLVEHGLSIAKQCSGVPLAVVVIAGALRGCTTQSEWKIVEDNVGQHLINKDDPKSCLKFVEMSYDHLPEEMKACFLYCGAFPRGYSIPAWKLIRLWISEGLITNSKLKKATLENIAEKYLNDLVNRSLLMVTHKKADGQVKTCRLHDMLYQFCEMEAKSGGLFEEVCKIAYESGLDIPDLDSSRRLCIQLSLLGAFISKIKGTSAEHVRSFLCFGTKQRGSEILSNIKDLHKALPLVRVLDLEPIKFSFSKFFEERFHLRYIAISGDFTALPAFFGKFWNLQTIILNTEKPTITIKADILKMERLRHLHANVPAVLLPPATKTATEEPSCLQTLSKVAPESCRKDVFARACHLRKVSIEGKMADFFDTNKGQFRNFEKLKCLENLKLLNDIGSSISKVLQLPPDFHQFLCKLKRLTLSNTRFAWSDANKLGNLECLEVLKLKENAFVGPTWDSEGFSQLQVLWIDRADLENWTVSNLSFKRLKCLVLKSCEKMKAVPFELADVSSLQEMTLEHTKAANQSAKTIEVKKKEILESMQKASGSKSATKSQALEISKFTLTIFPLETVDCNAT